MTAAPDSVWTWGLAEFRDRTASAAPTPGGGSAAMVSATIGIGLVLMALRVTARKADNADALTPLIDSGDRLMRELGDHADADIAVFQAYMEALSRPRGTDEEKAARRAGLAEAAAAATEIPLNAAQIALEALDLAHQAAHACGRQILSDVAAGAALLQGALTAVLYNVDINLPSIGDPEREADYRTSRNHLQKAGNEAHRRVMAAVSSRTPG